MNDFLLEVLVEEIPSRLQSGAIKEFENAVTSRFNAQRISYDSVKTFISPRRIVFSAKLNAKIDAFTEEKKGPQTTAPAEIIEKFLKANNISREQCIEKTIDKKTFVFANVEHEAKNTADLLGDIVRESIAAISWQKSMHWGKHQFHFVRPIRNIMAMFGGKQVNVTLPEIDLKSCDYTFGHRFLSPQKIQATDIDSYVSSMRRAFVIVSQEERKKIILDSFKKIENENNISVEVTESLLNEVVGLVEYPVVLLGHVPEKFMKLPEEAIITPMRTHQRYFPTRTADGKLAPFFVFVANNVATDKGATIIRGNERVLNARLADAYFFFETDLQKPLESHLEDLKKITFQEKLGTLYERTKSLSKVCDFVYEEISKYNAGFSATTAALLRRAATLAKCDLPTTMVCEFTELQGIMGGHYARIQEENPAVCDAIRDQYKAADDITAPVSALLALADKVEIITSFFAIGKEPTGSKDPFALRRAAIGILKIIKSQNLTIDLRNIVQKTFNQLTVKDLKPDTVNNVMLFIMDRLKVLLKDSGISHAVAKAVTVGESDILNAYRKAETLNEVLNSEVGEKLVSEYKRAKNIMQGTSTAADIDSALFSEQCEIDLFEAISTAGKKIENLNKDESTEACEKFKQQLSALIEIEPKVSAFFEQVLVNAEDEKIKGNRFALLNRLISVFNSLKLQTILDDLG
ncbi:MAG: glycine--tRNA ligase subunit beta [Alphaproteobacteria bacterium]|nr:glycine--tRNA ligase subunit beta [Alphaproteobacteria bacterium]